MRGQPLSLAWWLWSHRARNYLDGIVWAIYQVDDLHLFNSSWLYSGASLGCGLCRPGCRPPWPSRVRTLQRV